MSTVLLEVVSPDRVVFSQEVSFIVVKSGGGELGILPRHAPLAGTVKPCIVMARTPEREEFIAMTEGFLHVMPDRVTVLANAAEVGSQVDVERATRAKERAEKRLAERREDVDVVRAELALARALNRLQAASRYGAREMSGMRSLDE
jgi:F-type H+-transporting ATPase subunit epsilon